MIGWGPDHDERQRQWAGSSLYKVYRVISDLSRPEGLEPKSAVQAIVAQRRRFVSDVFRSVDPRRRDAALKNLGG